MNTPVTHPRLERLAKPTGRKRPVRHAEGDHGDCPAEPKHGPLIVIGQRLYCPHSGHLTTAEAFFAFPSPEPVLAASGVVE